MDSAVEDDAAVIREEIDTGFQTHPSHQQITAWIGTEYHGHLAEGTFHMDEFDAGEVRWWLSSQADSVLTARRLPGSPHRIVRAVDLRGHQS
jgi:hypothetical protein